MNEFDIENTWEMGKMVVTSMQYKLFLYKAPQYNLYVQSIRPIRESYPNNVKLHPYKFATTGPVIDIPHMVAVRFQDRKDMVRFIQTETQFKAYIVFKSQLYFRELTRDRMMGLFSMAAKNIVTNKTIGKPSTFRIKSNNPVLRDAMYELLTKYNADDKLGHSFDYNEYDYTVEIYVYKQFAHNYKVGIPQVPKGHAVVITVYGPNLPNHWKYIKEE